MAAANWHTLIFVNQRNEPHHRERVCQNWYASKCQKSRPDTRGMADVWKTRK